MKINRYHIPLYSLIVLIAATASPLMAGCGHDHSAETHPEAAVSGPVIHSYLAIQQALAADSMAGVADNAAKLHELADIPAAEKLAKADNIGDARKHFEVVSNHLIDAARMHGVEGHEVHLAHCPMAFGNRGASWLQADKNLANPYYGARMLRCGVFRDL